mmetsp:Transcript_6987/g.12660  ORF Transcript_6987/g.12660 Transcript_6987/m.12660 type:complete len:487 (-) Transcript_6987:78-1538(-)
MTLPVWRWQLPWPSLVISLVSLPIASAFILVGPTISPIPSSIRYHPRWNSPRPSRRASSRISSSYDSDHQGLSLDVLSSCPALQRLELSRDEIAAIKKRFDGRTPRKHHHQNDDVNQGIRIIAGIETNLAYFEQRLGLTVEQLRMVVVGYPPVLSLGLETNLMPTIAFFDDALNGGSINTHDDNDIDARRHQSRIAAFLSESPSLLEYNVAKRLVPRLEQVREMASKGAGCDDPVDENMLRAIATLTDSRFESWLLQNNETQSSGDELTVDNSNAENIVNLNSDDEKQSPPPRQPNDPSAYVIVSNLQSGGNIGNIVRSASIFGCEECIVVGQKRYRLTGDHGSRFDLPRRHVYSHSDAADYLRAKGVRIYGVEITEDAAPIMQYERETGIVKFPFDTEGGWSGAAFLFGNEGMGLSVRQREICDEFLFIPQNRGGTGDGGGGGSASMNVACAAAVILQAYCVWAGYSSARLEGEKFLADKRDNRM